MASTIYLHDDKYRIIVCNGKNENNKVKRITQVIQAKSLEDAKEKALIFEYEVKNGKLNKKKSME